MSTPGDDVGGSTGSPKEPTGRLRVSSACQHCRLRKIKCDGAVPCRKCTEAGIICQPGARRKKRAPSRKDEYIRELEKKLQDLHKSHSKLPQARSNPDRIEEDRVLPSTEPSTVERGTKFQYLRASSSLIPTNPATSTTPSRASPQPFDEETDVDEIDNQTFVLGTEDSDLDTNLQAVQAQLPGPNVIREHVNNYFAYFSPQCPIINEHEFKARVGAFIRGEGDNEPAESFLAILLMVLCFGEYIAAGDRGTDTVSEVPGWRFFLSAYSGAREGLRRANVEYMQAVTLQVYYLQTISKLSVAYVLLGNLIRLMQAAGMHRAQDLNTQEGVTRTDLMNFVYVLEKQLALGLGRPSLIHDFDCDFHTPSPPTTNLQRARNGNMAPFVHMARIAGDVHRLLYSPEAARGSSQSYLQSIEHCEADLERWRDLYLPMLPAGGLVKHEKELPAEAFNSGYGELIRPILMTYLYMLCSIRRAIPVSHTLNDGTKVAGMDQRGVDIAMSFIHIVHIDERPIDPSIWLSVYRAFTCGTILYQSIKTKLLLKYQPFSNDRLSDNDIVQQINALRILEHILMHKVRGYTGAARFFARVIKGWTDQFDDTSNLFMFGSGATPDSAGQQQRNIKDQHHGTPMDPAAQAVAAGAMSTSGPWSPTSMQHFAQYYASSDQPFPPSSTPTSMAFPTSYSHDLPALSLTTASSDYQGAYNWVSPAQFGAYGYAPEPPSAVAEHTDFSGAEMFAMGGGYGAFEVNDLMMPAWMPLQSTMPEQRRP